MAVSAPADYPTLQRFDTSKAHAFALFAPAASAPAIQSLTNAQKLSLPTNTAVGTRVSVTDGFVVSGTDADTDGFYYPDGTINGKPAYYLAGKSLVHRCIWDTENWFFVFSGNIFKNEDVAFPWLVTSWAGGSPTLTHPAVQELAAPSTAQGGVFVSGGTQNGIYTNRNSYAGQVQDHDVYGLLGTSDDDVVNSNASEILYDGDYWIIFDGGATGRIYYSASDTITPDLATDWKNQSDDSPASITVSSVAQGELDAGVTVAGAGTTAFNASYRNAGYYQPGDPPSSYAYAKTNGDGRSIAFLPSDAQWFISTDLSDPEGTQNYWADMNGIPPKFPLGLTWVTQSPGVNPAPTVTRNDVAAEANWHVVP